MYKSLKNDKTEQSKLYNYISKAIAVIIALIIWQITAMYVKQNILLVSPVDVIKRLCTIWREDNFLSSILFTCSNIISGWALGFLLGTALAALAYRFRIVSNLLWPWMMTIKSVPVASFVVVCLIWMTSKDLPVFISFLVVLPIVYQNIFEGLKSQDDKLLEMSYVFKIHLLKKIRYVILPQLGPFVISACRVSTGMAFKAGVAGEIIGIPEGSIGKMLYLSKIFIDTDDLLAWTVIIVVLSVLFEKLVVLIVSNLPGIRVGRKRCISWRK